MLHGVVAAALTPLSGGGSMLDEEAFPPYVDFLVSHGVDGILAMGSTGEGVLFDLDERRRITDLFVDAAGGRVQVAAHCGAQTTADTVELAEHAATSGADAIAVIGPPYFPLDADELFVHFAEAARACAPLPFYVYEFQARSGYSVPVETLTRLREEASNFVGMKVSNAAWESFEPYLLDGLDIFAGSEPLLPRALAAGAAGTVSGLASCFPDVIVSLARDPSSERGERVAALRAAVQRLPFQSAGKTALGLRGVPVRALVRPPLRGLRDDERAEVERIVAEFAG